MSDLLKNKNILIMGVANKWSIAWGIAKQAYQNGAQLLFSYYGDKSLRSLEKLTTEENIKNVKFVECDVTQDENIEKTFDLIKEEFGVLHGVAHCIAHAKREELEGEYVNTSRDGYAMAQDISAYSLVAVSRYARPLMTEGGSIITLSYHGGVKAVKNYNVMGVAKAALEASVRYLAVDLGKEDIRVNAISAGPIKTASARGVSDLNEMLSAFAERAPLKRPVDQEEIGKAAVFLLSSMSSAITGEILYVDCGYNILG